MSFGRLNGMPVEPRVSSLVSELREDIGIDIYELVEGEEEKCFFGAAAIGAILIALIAEYLKGLLNCKEAGEARALYFKAILDKFRKRNLASGPTVTDEELEKGRQISVSEPEAAQAAMATCVADLQAAGFPEALAVTMVEKIAKAVAGCPDGK